MASPTRLSLDFDRFVSDVPRDRLPPNAAYRMRDYMTKRGADPRKRGGWNFASDDLNTISPPVTSLSGLMWAPFPQDGHLMMVSDRGKVFLTRSANGAGDIFVANSAFASGISHRPIWHNTGKVILLQAHGQTPLTPQKYYSGSPGVAGATYSVADLGGTPPLARVGWSWGDYLVLANGYIGATLYSNRVWFSDVTSAANPDAWDTDESFWDMPDEVVGGCIIWDSSRASQLVFGYSSVWLLTGSTPPPGSDMVFKPLFASMGCMDGRTICTWRDYAIWATNSGVYLTDGALQSNLCEKGGISRFWRETAAAFSLNQGWSASAGVLNNHYVVTIMDPDDNETTLMCDLDTYAWKQVTNVPACMYAERGAWEGTSILNGGDGLFFAHKTLPRAGETSSFFMPSSINTSDGDGSPVEPELETPFYDLGNSGIKRFRRVYVNYELNEHEDAAYLEVGHVMTPSETVNDYAGLLGDNTFEFQDRLPTTTATERKAIDVRRKGNGIAFWIRQQYASLDTRLRGLEIEGHPLEGSR